MTPTPTFHPPSRIPIVFVQLALFKIQSVSRPSQNLRILGLQVNLKWCYIGAMICFNKRIHLKTLIDSIN